MSFEASVVIWTAKINAHVLALNGKEELRNMATHLLLCSTNNSNSLKWEQITFINLFFFFLPLLPLSFQINNTLPPCLQLVPIPNMSTPTTSNAEIFRNYDSNSHPNINAVQASRRSLQQRQKTKHSHSREIPRTLLQAPWTEHVLRISARMPERSCLEQRLTKRRRRSTPNALYVANPGGLSKPSVWVTLYENKEH